MADNDSIGAIGGVAWTPSDTAVIPGYPRGFQVGVGGDVALEYRNGTTVTWPACAEGMVHAHFGFVKLRATGTTATTIVVAY